MIILGINAYHGDAAAAIVKDGKLIAAAEEERFNRFKHCAGFPTQAVKYCLTAAGVGIEKVDHVGISRDPSAHLHKKILFAASRAAKQASSSVWRASGPSSNVAVVESAEDNSNGDGPGVFRQIRDRLGNAARVRDLKQELARQLNTSTKSIRA
ncbi:MAG: hypothetical protein C5B55_11115, partial [Blastocatellia bacterium]